MKKQLLLIAVLALSGGIARAQTATTSKPDSVDAVIAEIKKPVDWFTWGGDMRIRNEYFNNALTLSERVVRHEQDYFRFRERVWLAIQPITDLSVNARLTAEEREWMRPAFAKQFGFQEGLEDRYGILDNANVKWANALSLPLTVVAGRQDIFLGDTGNWWLVMDGTPYDGSWTTFFDSIRATYTAAEIQTKFDLIYIYQNALPDETIPTIGQSSNNRHPSALVPGSAPYWLTEQNEQGAIFYVSNKSVKDTQIDGYFIYKHDTQEGLIRSPYGTPLGDNANIFTMGGKVTGTPAAHWKYSAEGAYQFGTKQDPMVRVPVVEIGNRDIDAFGVNSNLNYLFKDTLENEAGLIFEYLSGDNPKTTGRDEMFDVLWGRWPRWSELYIYSYPNETAGKIAQLNNILRLGPTWGFTPIKDTTFRATYNALFAPEDVPTRTVAPALFSQSGGFRGHYLQTVLKHRFNKYVTGHLWGEWVWEGDYYTRRDMMTFLRAELMFTF